MARAPNAATLDVACFARDTKIMFGPQTKCYRTMIGSPRWSCASHRSIAGSQWSTAPLTSLRGAGRYRYHHVLRCVQPDGTVTLFASFTETSSENDMLFSFDFYDTLLS